MRGKKFVLAAFLTAMTLVGGTALADNGIYLPSEIADASPLYNQYPCIGASEASVYYADPGSYYATSDGNIAHLGCLFYATGGGAAPGGGPAKLTPYTVDFTTYSRNGSRHISYVVKNKSGQAVPYFRDDRFMSYLFTLVAQHTWIGPYL